MIEKGGNKITTEVTLTVNETKQNQQSKTGSIVETLMNTAIGFLITLVFSPLIYTMCNVEISPFKMGMSTLCFTVLSVIRGYCIRRWFTKVKI